MSVKLSSSWCQGLQMAVLLDLKGIVSLSSGF